MSVKIETENVKETEARAVLPDGQKYSFRILDDALIGMEEWRKDHKSLAPILP